MAQTKINASQTSITAEDIGAAGAVTALPTASATEEGKIYQFTGTTDANYTNGYFYKCVSDGAVTPTYSWTQVNVQPQGDSLPSQSGQSGKFLTTNGSAASWATISALQNTATGNDALTILGNPSSQEYGLNIGANSTASGWASIALGSWSQATKSGALCIGGEEASGKNAIAIGRAAKATATGAVMINTTDSIQINSNANTLAYGNANGAFEVVSADGTVPSDRLKNSINKYSTMPTAASTNLGWIVQYTGTTDSTYTHGYIYECTTDGSTYSWTQTNVQPAGGGSSLPSQTGNAGKFLTTDGTDASWAAINALQNTATGANSLTLLGNSADKNGCINIGYNSSVTVGYNGIAIGNNAQASSQNGAVEAGIAIGTSARVKKSYQIAIGHGAEYYINTLGGCIALGYYAKVSATDAMQINFGRAERTNSDSNTLKIANNNGNYEIMSADGTIPTDRFTTTPSADGTYVPTLTISSGVATRSWAAPSGGGAASATATLAVADWSNGSQTVNVTGVTASNNVIVAAAPASQSDYASFGVLCTAQGAGTLTFTCTTTPTNAITVNVLII